METRDPTHAAMLRPFAETLAEVDKGRVADTASAKLADLVAEVRATGKKGTIQVTLTVSTCKGNDELIQVSGNVAVKRPQAEARMSIFYPDASGNLHRDDPNALPLFPADQATGAIR